MQLNTKSLWNIGKRIIPICSGLIIIFGVIDYFVKWRILPFIWSIVLVIWNFLVLNILEIFIFLWLIVISLIFFKHLQHSDKGSDTEKINKEELSKNIQDELVLRIKDTEDKFSRILASAKSGLKSEIDDIKRDLIDLTIEDHKKKGQVGALSKMIEKLKLNIEQGWGEEDALYEIKEYIENHGMPNFYFADLNKALDKVSNDYKPVKEDILTVAKNKFYKP